MDKPEALAALQHLRSEMETCGISFDHNAHLAWLMFQGRCYASAKRYVDSIPENERKIEHGNFVLKLMLEEEMQTKKKYDCKIRVILQNREASRLLQNFKLKPNSDTWKLLLRYDSSSRHCIVQEPKHSSLKGSTSKFVGTTERDSCVESSLAPTDRDQPTALRSQPSKKG